MKTPILEISKTFLAVILSLKKKREKNGSFKRLIKYFRKFSVHNFQLFFFPFLISLNSTSKQNKNPILKKFPKYVL